MKRKRCEEGKGWIGYEVEVEVEVGWFEKERRFRGQRSKGHFRSLHWKTPSSRHLPS